MCLLCLYNKANHGNNQFQHRGEQYDHQVRLLQHEHSVLWRTLADTNAVLTRLKSAFDPLTVLPEPSSEVASILGLAENCRGMAEVGLILNCQFLSFTGMAVRVIFLGVERAVGRLQGRR